MAKAYERKLTDFTPDDANANKHTPRGQLMLETGLRKLGAGRSILVDKNNKVIAGNLTQEVALDIGLTDAIVVPTDGKQLVVVQRTDIDLDTPEGRELAISDNRIAQVSIDFDGDVLASLQAESVDLSWMFYEDELAALIEPPPPAADPGPQIDRADELQARWQVKRGDLWSAGKHRLLCGDSTNADDVARVMGGEKANAVVTDSPYGIDRDGIVNDNPETLAALFNDVLEVLPVDNAVIINFQSPRLEWVWLDAIRRHGHKPERLLWMYDENDQTFPWHNWLMCSQAIRVSSLGSPKWGDCLAHHDTYVIGLAREFRAGGDGNDYSHASVKPLGVIIDLLKHTTGIVYDPFLGSGTTLVACEQTGRIGRGIEISEKYCAVALDRLAQMGLTPRLETQNPAEAGLKRGER